ncbi:MAG: helicase HerA-like domain-containing protein, partial [Sulfurimicrobium sp.]
EDVHGCNPLECRDCRRAAPDRGRELDDADGDARLRRPEIGDLLGGGSGRSNRQGVAEAAIKSAARAIGSQVGREIIRGVLGSILGGRR